MNNLVYVTGNKQKAKYFSAMMQMDIPHINLDVDEIQSTNISEVVEHKARQAYKKVKKPVIVEDSKLTFASMGGLPGPLIKWFELELGYEGLCRLLDGKDRTAYAGAAIAYFDGINLEIFERELEGSILEQPTVGESAFGWNVIFRPKGSKKSFAQMSKAEFHGWYAKTKPFDELKHFLESIDTIKA